MAQAAPTIEVSPRSALLAVNALDASDMARVGKEINKQVVAMAKTAGVANNRKMRLLRLAEVSEIAPNLSRTQIRTWREQHKEELESYTPADADGTKGMHQLPLTLAEVHRMMDDIGVRPRRPQGSRALRIGVFNFKGGSTKTSTTLHLATYFAIQGWRTLVIDADPQGSLSSIFSLDPEDVDSQYTLGPAFKAIADGSGEAPHLRPLKTHIDGLDIVPANLDLIGADFDVANAFMQSQRQGRGFYNVVSSAIAKVEDAYDVVFIDGAPAFSFSSLAVMWAADGMVVPVPPAAPDFKATAAFCTMASETLESLTKLAGVQGRKWAPFLFLHNRVRARQASELIMNLSRDVFGSNRFDTAIMDSTAVPSALNMLMSVYEATAPDVDLRALRAARTAYNEVGRRLEAAIRDAWHAGFAQSPQEVSHE